ncbi:MAG: M20/M25/M40 family metallo-hydrolase [Thermotogae bacterium]|nr:M20/M25/M40 family metallo-hydrolase [Thermotogota bacterium]
MDSLRSLLKTLIQFESVAERTDQLIAIINYAEKYLEHPNLRIDRFLRNEKPSLVASFKKSNRDRHFKVIFAGHLDVVPADMEQFIAREEDGKIYGRGALDMKGPCAVMMKLFKDLAEEGSEYDIALMLTTDEEIGSQNGVRYLLEEEGYSSDFAVIPDSGENFHIITDEKGALHFAVEFSGKPAHGSMPWLGESAIEKAIAFYGEARASLLYDSDDPEHWHNTLTLGRFVGGNKVNQVPPNARIELDFRFVPPYTLEEAKSVVRYLAKKYGAKVEFLSDGEPFSTDLEHPISKAFIESVREVLGEVRFGKTHGATDGRFFAKKGIPVMMIYPEGGDIHGSNEWVSIPSLEKLYRIFRTFVERVG